jgi:hypothetical protein
MSLLFGLVVSVSAQQTSTFIPLTQWEALQGDRFIVDTQENVGYLVHENGDYTSFLVGSGRREWVYYIGRSYKATTPAWRWSVKSTSVKGDRRTFGKTGRFMRLYKNGDEHTSYGIHATSNIDEILAMENRYKSMGCILVDDAVLDILYKMYELNGESIDVVTTYGIDEKILSQLN